MPSVPANRNKLLPGSALINSYILQAHIPSPDANATLGVIKTNSMDASLATAQVTAAATSHLIKKKTHKRTAGVRSKVARGRQSAAFENLDEMRALSCDAALDWEIKRVDRSVWATGVN